MDYIKELRKDIGDRKIILNCAGAIIVRDDKILLQLREDNNRWGLIGGLVELNETYEEAARREIYEETSLKVEFDAFLGIFHNHNMMWNNGDKAHVIAAYFIAHIVGGKLKKDHESLDLKFFDINELPPLFAEDHIEAIKAYKRGIRLPLLNENKK